MVRKSKTNDTFINFELNKKPSNRKISNRKTSNRKTSNRKTSNRKTSNRKTSNKKTSNKKTSSEIIKYNNFFDTYTAFEPEYEKYSKTINKIDLSSKNYDLEIILKKLHSENVSPSTFSKKDDFYSYVNDRWLKYYSIKSGQDYIVQVDNFRLVQDKVYKQLLEIVIEYINTDKSKQAKNMSNLLSSLLLFIRPEQSMNYANLILTQIDSYRTNKNNLWDLLGFVNSIEVVSWASPFVWSLNPDDKHPDIYRCNIDLPKLTLLDIDIYFDNDYDTKKVKEYKINYRKKYNNYLKDLFKNVFGNNHKFNVDDVYEVELKILAAMGCYKIKTKNATNYNIIKTDEALKKYGFDWNNFALSLGMKYTPDFFITSNLNYLSCMTKLLLDEWDSETWRTYWIYIFIRQEQRFGIEGHINYFKFEGEFVRGMKKDIDNDLEDLNVITVAPIFVIGYAYNTFLTNNYIDKYQEPQNIAYVKSMAEDLKSVFIRIIKRNKWLQPSTKKMALKKLYNFNLTVGSPKILREDPNIEYSFDDQWGNILKIALWRHEKLIKLEGKNVIDIPSIDWSVTPIKFTGTQAYVVNASYTPTENGIYIPLGYIQKPFVDLEERGIEYNLAYIGYTIAHEMSHALDDWGSQYDEKGALNNWWTEKDKKYFESIQKDVIKQYETFAAYDGIVFDAEPTIGEDLADISGLTICREYLVDFQSKNNDILMIRKLSFEAFFVYFAYQQRQKIGKRALEAQLKTNPHPLDKYRTNVPLSRLGIFRSIYDIKKGDKMWWHSTNRVWEN
jgi:putative endopeptidase